MFWLPQRNQTSNSPSAFAISAASSGLGTTVLARDDLGELLDGRLGRGLVERDLPVAKQVDPVGDLEDVDEVVRDQDQRDVLLLQLADQLEDQPPLEIGRASCREREEFSVDAV